MFRWLRKRFGRPDDETAAYEARIEEQLQSDWIDRSAGHVIGVQGDSGSTVPGAQSPQVKTPRR